MSESLKAMKATNFWDIWRIQLWVHPRDVLWCDGRSVSRNGHLWAHTYSLSHVVLDYFPFFTSGGIRFWCCGLLDSSPEIDSTSVWWRSWCLSATDIDKTNSLCVIWSQLMAFLPSRRTSWLLPGLITGTPSKVLSSFSGWNVLWNASLTQWCNTNQLTGKLATHVPLVFAMNKMETHKNAASCLWCFQFVIKHQNTSTQNQMCS